jgi:hypothetical protein
MVSFDYSKYKLKENPFPQNAVIDVNSEDPRVNGTIFCDKIFEREIAEIEKEIIDYKINLIYICGLQYERGVGKSALMAYFWRKVRENDKIFTAFVELAESGFYSTPEGFCALILQELHKRGYLWNMLLKCLLRYAEETEEIPKESIEIMLEYYKRPPESVLIQSFIPVFRTEQLIRNFVNWIASKSSCDKDHLTSFINVYLVHPAEYPKRLLSKKRDLIKNYEETVKFLQFAGYEYGYFFLNQFEWSVPQSAKLREFCIGMRRMLEASENKASIIVTLHPDAYKKLTSPMAEHLKTLAPFDGRHYKALNVLPKDGKLAVLLAEKYIKFFRSEAIDDPTYPFDPLTIRYTCFLSGGNIREILQTLHKCLDVAVRLNHPKIDLDFAIANHSEIFGRDFNREKFKEFIKIVRE